MLYTLYYRRQVSDHTTDAAASNAPITRQRLRTLIRCTRKNSRLIVWLGVVRSGTGGTLPVHGCCMLQPYKAVVCISYIYSVHDIRI